jgi:hypothetical protein
VANIFALSLLSLTVLEAFVLYCGLIYHSFPTPQIERCSEVQYEEG